MRTLLAILIFVGGTFLPSSTADAARKAKRLVKPSYYYAVPPRYFRESACFCGYAVIGKFAGFPGWARKAFSEGRR